MVAAILHTGGKIWTFIHHRMGDGDFCFGVSPPAEYYLFEVEIELRSCFFRANCGGLENISQKEAELERRALR